MIDGIVICGKGVDTDRAKALATRFETEVLTSRPDNRDAVYFFFDKTGISFICGDMELKGDFTRLLPRVTGGHLEHEIILKAAKFPQTGDGEPRAVDATAGLGEDSFILAARGYRVELFEHNPITAVLLHDALIRAKNTASCKDIARRMSMWEGDSEELLKKLSYSPELIYLDPMFPEKKKSSETKKKLQLLHRIEPPCADENRLLQAAIDAKPKKIMIKRPADGPFLADMTPTYSVTRTAVRFDCLVFSE